MYKQSLIQAGLSDEQAEVYEILIKSGELPARKIAQKTTIKRGLVYKTLERLMEIGLVEKDDKKKAVAIFKPKHPLILKEIAETKKQQAENNLFALNGMMSQLNADFNLASGKPGVQFYEGVDGMKKIYDDILDYGKSFHLIVAYYHQDPVYIEKIIPVINDFIKKRVKKEMMVVSMTPRSGSLAKDKERESKDKETLIARTWVEKSEYSSPVEIDIYGNKVAILSFGKELIGTVVESPQIADAMRDLFVLAKKGAGKK